MQSLLNGSLCIERVSGINLSRNLSWDNLQDFLSEFNQETIKGGFDLLVNVSALILSICNSDVDELGILGLLGCLEDKRRVGGSVLGLVFADGLFPSVLCSRIRLWGRRRRFEMNSRCWIKWGSLQAKSPMNTLLALVRAEIAE